jgi:hypothetical protein
MWWNTKTRQNRKQLWHLFHTTNKNELNMDHGPKHKTKNF